MCRAKLAKQKVVPACLWLLFCVFSNTMDANLPQPCVAPREPSKRCGKNSVNPPSVSLLQSPESLAVLLAGLYQVRVIRQDTTDFRVSPEQAISMFRTGAFHWRLHKSGRLRYIRENAPSGPAPFFAGSDFSTQPNYWDPSFRDGRAVLQPHACTGEYLFS